MQESSTPNDSKDNSKDVPTRKKIKLSLRNSSSNFENSDKNSASQAPTPPASGKSEKPRLTLSNDPSNSQSPRRSLKPISKDSQSANAPIPFSPIVENNSNNPIPGTQRIEFSQKPPRPQIGSKTENPFAKPKNSEEIPQKLDNPFKKLREREGQTSGSKTVPPFAPKPSLTKPPFSDKPASTRPPFSDKPSHTRPPFSEKPTLTRPPFPVSKEELPMPSSSTTRAPFSHERLVPSMPPIDRVTNPPFVHENDSNVSPFTEEQDKKARAGNSLSASTLRNKTKVQKQKEDDHSQVGVILLILLILSAALGYFLYNSFFKNAGPKEASTEEKATSSKDPEEFAGFPSAEAPAFVHEDNVPLSERPFSQSYYSSSSETNPKIASFIDTLEINVVKVSGANQGVFINKVFYKTGEIINDDMGITFLGFETQRNELVFRDSKGALYYRYY